MSAQHSPFSPDPRFFATTGPLSIDEAVAMVGATVTSAAVGGAQIAHVAPLAAAGEGAVTYAAKPGALEGVEGIAPALILVTDKAAEIAAARLPGCAVAVVADPRVAHAKLAAHLHKSSHDLPVSDCAHLPEAEIAQSAYVDPTAVVMRGAQIGAGAHIGPLALIGYGVTIGEGTRVGSHASITHAVVGKNCQISAGVRVGEAGFGYAPSGGGIMAIPQLGRVVIEDEVDLGANTTVDRGTLGDTLLRLGTKIDNLCQIAHNCDIGPMALIASQTGISGSCRIGAGVLLGGQVGMADHLTIGDGAMVTAKAGLMKDIPAGERWGGTPAKPAREWMKETAALSRLAKTKSK